MARTPCSLHQHSFVIVAQRSVKRLHDQINYGQLDFHILAGGPHGAGRIMPTQTTSWLRSEDRAPPWCVCVCLRVFSLAACTQKSVQGPSFTLSDWVGYVLSKLFPATEKSAFQVGPASGYGQNIPRLSSEI